MRPSLSTISHKVAHSYSAQYAAGIPFGDPTPPIPPLEELASRGSGYDPQVAYLLSVISTWAYADERALASKLRYYGMQGAHVRRIAIVNDALLVVATAYLILNQKGNVGVLAFRGTDPTSVISILADTEVMQRPFFGAAVHSGFFANVEALWDDTTHAVDRALSGWFVDGDTPPAGLESPPDIPLETPLEALYVTGHSLGGAMAVLATARLFHPGYEYFKPETLLKGVYTFGQPMVGDDRFAEFCSSRFGARFYRHVYRRDPVPHLPPQSPVSYAHAGYEWRSARVDEAWTLSKDKSERAPIAEALLEVVANAIETRLIPNKRLGGFSLDDHMPSNYLDVSRYSVNPTSVAKPPERVSRLSSLAGAVAAARENVGEAIAKFRTTTMHRSSVERP